MLPVAVSLKQPALDADRDETMTTIGDEDGMMTRLVDLDCDVNENAQNVAVNMKNLLLRIVVTNSDSVGIVTKTNVRMNAALKMSFVVMNFDDDKNAS